MDNLNKAAGWWFEVWKGKDLMNSAPKRIKQNKLTIPRRSAYQVEAVEAKMKQFGGGEEKLR